MTIVPCFEEPHLEQICRVLGNAVTGSEISRMFGQLNIPDDDPTGTKWRRLHLAFSKLQRQEGHGNRVVAFMYKAMNPVRYTSNSAVFALLRSELNQILAFCGYSLEENGKLRVRQAARTLDETQEKASKLRIELSRRDVHPDVLKFCRAELVAENYFHAVLEATKSVAEKVRQCSGLTSDGSALVDEAFGLGRAGVPVLALNSLQMETERNEQVGVASIMKGMFSAFRNPTAHAPKISWRVSEQDAYDC